MSLVRADATTSHSAGADDPGPSKMPRGVKTSSAHTVSGMADRPSNVLGCTYALKHPDTWAGLKASKRGFTLRHRPEFDALAKAGPGKRLHTNHAGLKGSYNGKLERATLVVFSPDSYMQNTSFSIFIKVTR